MRQNRSMERVAVGTFGTSAGTRMRQNRPIEGGGERARQFVELEFVELAAGELDRPWAGPCREP